VRHNRLTQTLLAPIGSLYGAIIQTRTKLYENGRLKSQDLGLPVVSVGNITVGGTGKTPLVKYVAEKLNENGHRVCILTRGYKRKNPNNRVVVSDGEKILADVASSGDEPFELARKLLGTASVVADKKRYEAGIWAKENFGATAFVLDDGFQHLRLKRDLDIVSVDATNPFGNEKMLPAGILREPLKNLKRADLIVLTRANLSPSISNLKSQMKKYNDNCPILLARNEIKRLTPLWEFLCLEKKQIRADRSDSSKTFVSISELRASVFCALGNPSAFFRDLEQFGVRIVASTFFQDHYNYLQKDADAIVREAKSAGASALVTTAKDAVKLENIKFEMPCFVAEAETVFDDAEPLLRLLKKL
jgi:tetraacyldisaccharide 4'-kinase